MGSRSRARISSLARSKRRHTGFGKRRGTRNARLGYKVLWNRTISVTRRLLRKYRKTKKITKHLYREFYLKSKGNSFKNKRILLETIYRVKADIARDKALSRQSKAS